MYSQPTDMQQEIVVSENQYADPAAAISVFCEKSRVVHDDERSRLSAHTLFSSFTAEIIKENTAFTR